MNRAHAVAYMWWKLGNLPEDTRIKNDDSRDRIKDYDIKYRAS